MGGGDLNLKKSWHPNTLKNQERVWKAEQQKQEEDNKISELKQKLREEQLKEELEQTGIKSGKLKKNENADLNWMYKGPSSLVSRESYLLGRKIDKSFETLEKEENEQEVPDENKSSYKVEHDINPEPIIHKDQNNKQVDMKRKLLEDPLLMIRQNEEATKRAITSNPIKMKNLQLLIESLKEKKKKKKKKNKNISVDIKSKKKKSKEKKKKKEKNKKKKKESKRKSKDSDESTSSSSEEGSNETSDKEKATRRKKIKLLIDAEIRRATERRESSHRNDCEDLKREGSRRNEENRESDERERRIVNEDRKRLYYKEKDSEMERHQYNQSRGREKRNRSRSRSKGREKQSRSRSRSREREKRNKSRSKGREKRSRSRSRSREREKRNRSESGSRGREKQSSRSLSRGKEKRSRSRGRYNRSRSGSKESRLEDLMRRKREEMKENALKRDDQRKKNVERYKEELKKEEEEEKNSQGFVKNLGSVSVGSSVESRIRSKVSSAQRGSSHMESSFIRK